LEKGKKIFLLQNIDTVLQICFNSLSNVPTVGMSCWGKTENLSSTFKITEIFRYDFEKNSASAIALALAGGQASAAIVDLPLCGSEADTGGSGMACRNTSSVDGRFILDKIAVAEGGKINLSLMALDETGKVDLNGNQRGSTIMAQVTSQVGNVMEGGAAGDSPAPGAFSASVKYVTLEQGNGRVWIEYPDGIVVGENPITDTINIVLQERFENQRGGVTTNVLANASKTVTINPSTPKIKKLDITSFEISTEDTVNGMSDGIYDTNEDGILNGTDDNAQDGDGTTNGVDGQMTAGKAGGQITMAALKSNGNIEQRAFGTATLVLSGLMSGQTYTYPASMVRGQAIFTIPSEVTKADTYYIKGTLEGYGRSSVDLYDDDTLTIVPTGTPNKLKLSSQKTVIAKGKTATPIDSFETMVNITMLDEYGNTLSVNPNAGGNPIKISSDNTDVIGSGVVSYPQGEKKAWFKVGGNSETDTNTLGIVTDNYGNVKVGVYKVGSSNLTAEIENQTAIAPSDPLKINVVEKQLRAFVNDGTDATITPVGGSPFLTTTFANPPRLAGEEFKGFLVDVWTGLTGDSASVAASIATTMQVDHFVEGKKVESLTPTLDLNDTVLEVLFQEATSDGAPAEEYYMISDKNGLYGQVIVPNQGANTNPDIMPAAADQVHLINGHEEIITSVSTSISSVSGKNESLVPESQLDMTDAFGNSITSSNAGTVTMSSANGAAIVKSTDAKGVPGNGSLVPGQLGDAWKASYSVEGVDVFTGEDIFTLGFTKPGVGTLDITTNVPEKLVLAEIVPNIEQTIIPQNAEVALTLETLDQYGDLFNDPKSVNQGVQITFTGDLTPRVIDNDTDAVLVSGSNIKFSTGAEEGRKVLIIEAGALEGSFTLTFTNADKDISAVKEFTVTSQLVQECAAGAESLCMTEAECTAVGGAWDAAATPSCSAGGADVCSTSNLAACVDETECVNVGGEWDAANTPSCSTGTSQQTGVISTGILGDISVNDLPPVPDGTVAGTFGASGFGEHPDPKFRCAFGGADGNWMTSGNIAAADTTAYVCDITVAPEHVGQPVDVLVVGYVQPSPAAIAYYNVVEGVLPFENWDQTAPGTIATFRSVASAPEQISINMYEGPLPLTFKGHLTVFVGYRAEDGTIFFNLNNTLEVDVP